MGWEPHYCEVWSWSLTLASTLAETLDINFAIMMMTVNGNGEPSVVLRPPHEAGTSVWRICKTLRSQISRLPRKLVLPVPALLGVEARMRTNEHVQ